MPDSRSSRSIPTLFAASLVQSRQSESIKQTQELEGVEMKRNETKQNKRKTTQGLLEHQIARGTGLFKRTKATMDCLSNCDESIKPAPTMRIRRKWPSEKDMQPPAVHKHHESAPGAPHLLHPAADGTSRGVVQASLAAQTNSRVHRHRGVHEY